TGPRSSSRRSLQPRLLDALQREASPREAAVDQRRQSRLLNLLAREPKPPTRAHPPLDRIWLTESGCHRNCSEQLRPQRQHRPVLEQVPEEPGNVLAAPVVVRIGEPDAGELAVFVAEQLLRALATGEVHLAELLRRVAHTQRASGSWRRFSRTSSKIST